LNSVLKRDFEKFMVDTDKVQEYIEVLRQENTVYAMGRRQRDLTQLTSHIIRLDFDLSAMLLDCFILGRQYWKKHDLPLINSLHCSLAIMHNLFNDLNRAKPTLREASVEPSDLRQLFMDWIRFKKSVSDMRIYLQHSNMRRKGVSV
jgi:hypothetical protein